MSVLWGKVTERSTEVSEVNNMEDNVKACAKDIIDVIKTVHYSPDFSDFRINRGCRGEIECIIEYIQWQYLREVN